MALQCGIVGLPNNGKFSFQLLIECKKHSLLTAFCTIETECRRDHRTGRTFEQTGRNRTSPACYPYYGGNRRHRRPCKKAPAGEGLGNKFLPIFAKQMQSCMYCVASMTTILFMWTAVSIRFATKEIIDTELQIKDLETIDSRIAKVQKQAQTGGDKQAKIAYEVLYQI